MQALAGVQQDRELGGDLLRRRAGLQTGLERWRLLLAAIEVIADSTERRTAGAVLISELWPDEAEIAGMLASQTADTQLRYGGAQVELATIQFSPSDILREVPDNVVAGIRRTVTEQLAAPQLAGRADEHPGPLGRGPGGRDSVR